MDPLQAKDFLHHAQKERQRLLEEKQRVQDELQAWENIISGLTKLVKEPILDSPQTTSPLLVFSYQRASRSPQIAQVRDWTINRIREQGFVYRTEIAEQFPDTPEKPISAMLDRDKRFKYDKDSKKWTFEDSLDDVREGL